MINYPEFESLTKLADEKNPFSAFYEYADGSRFYIEPVFYTHLMGFKEHHLNDYDLIIQEMERIVHKNKHVVFTGNYENPQTEVDGYIFLEITDVTNPLHIFVEDKSRGSDYGD